MSPNQILNGIMTPVTEARFKSKTAQTASGCLVWQARTDQDGYGVFTIRRRAVRAHRIAFEHHVGLIPEGLVIDHICRNRACVNPNHLEAVSNKLNVLRGEGRTAQNAVATQCVNGHAYDEANTYRDSRGKRACRACARERGRRRPSRAKKRQGVES